MDRSLLSNLLLQSAVGILAGLTVLQSQGHTSAPSKRLALFNGQGRHLSVLDAVALKVPAGQAVCVCGMRMSGCTLMWRKCT